MTSPMIRANQGQPRHKLPSHFAPRISRRSTGKSSSGSRKTAGVRDLAGLLEHPLVTELLAVGATPPHS